MKNGTGRLGDAGRRMDGGRLIADAAGKRSSHREETP